VCRKERFAKFIELIEERMQVISLSSPLDYRHMQIQGNEQTYFYPLGPLADQFVQQALNRLTHTPPKKGTLRVHGRLIAFKLYDDGIGRFTFQDLCETALGPADYLAIAMQLDTLILTDIPHLGPEKRNEAKRFVTLIDALYEYKVKLVATAEVAPEAIYNSGDGSFEFKRTVSRLIEMQSAKWMKHE
jgi:cell division protein ZapE